MTSGSSMSTAAQSSQSSSIDQAQRAREVGLRISAADLQPISESLDAIGRALAAIPAEIQQPDERFDPRWW
ncbi:MAG: hypothetical protein JWQ95_5518 [Sphaerisporangium sp.]|jgi:hypothetical protein|nr:hypothetical protein [Sphaerisporangium sp.]